MNIVIDKLTKGTKKKTKKWIDTWKDAISNQLSVSKKRFPNYENAKLATHIIAKLQEKHAECFYINFSNKFTPQELVLSNKAENIIIDEDNRIIYFKKESILTNTIIWSTQEPSGGDLFIINIKTFEVIAGYELKIGTTVISSMPLNSIVSAFQAVYGEHCHYLDNGIIRIHNEMSVPERESIIFMDDIIRRFGSMKNFQEVEKETRERLANEKLKPVPIIHMNPETGTIDCYSITATSIASRTTGHKVTRVII